MRRAIFISGFLVLAFFIPFATTFAEDNNDSNDNITQTRDQRLQSAVTSQSLVLDDSYRHNVVVRCQNSQSILRGVQEQSANATRTREAVYSEIIKDVRAIKIRMARQGSDASEADLFLGRMQESLDQFTLNANQYALSLDDVVSVDCQTNPEQFMAGLVVMRSHRLKVSNSADKLHSIVVNSIKDTFTPLKKRLTI